MKYNKLVRDKVPEILQAKDVTYKVHTAGNKEYWSKLKLKLAEEVVEFSADESLEELADIEEVKLAIMEYKGWTKEQLETVRVKKQKERGGFIKKVILEES